MSDERFEKYVEKHLDELYALGRHQGIFEGVLYSALALCLFYFARSV